MSLAKTRPIGDIGLTACGMAAAEVLIGMCLPSLRPEPLAGMHSWSSLAGTRKKNEKKRGEKKGKGKEKRKRKRKKKKEKEKEKKKMKEREERKQG